MQAFYPAAKVYGAGKGKTNVLRDSLNSLRGDQFAYGLAALERNPQIAKGAFARNVKAGRAEGIEMRNLRVLLLIWALLAFLLAILNSIQLLIDTGVLRE